MQSKTGPFMVSLMPRWWIAFIHFRVKEGGGIITPKGARGREQKEVCTCMQHRQRAPSTATPLCRKDNFNRHVTSRVTKLSPISRPKKYDPGLGFHPRP